MFIEVHAAVDNVTLMHRAVYVCVVLRTSSHPPPTPSVLLMLLAIMSPRQTGESFLTVKKRERSLKRYKSLPLFV